jgi:hypothetical protein
MPWIKDYFSMCSVCGNAELQDGRNQRAAASTARQKGWSINPMVCPKCRGNLTKRALDGAKAPREKVLGHPNYYKQDGWIKPNPPRK